MSTIYRWISKQEIHSLRRGCFCFRGNTRFESGGSGIADIMEYTSFECVEMFQGKPDLKTSYLFRSTENEK